MASWTVHLPPKDDAGVSNPERFVVVKDGFRPLAVLFGPLWLIGKRLWWAALGAVLIEAAIYGLAWQGVPPRPGPSLLISLFHLLLGLEASTLQRWTLRRNGWREVGAFIAHGRAEAEARAADLVAALADTQPTFAPTPSPRLYPAAPPAAAPVLGLFPEARPR